jgi:hypothetical protein
MRFELMREEPNRLAVYRLNHSATPSHDYRVVHAKSDIFLRSQSLQSARLFLQSSELSPHTPSSFASVGGGTHSLAGERVGGFQFGRVRVDRH